MGNETVNSVEENQINAPPGDESVSQDTPSPAEGTATPGEGAQEGIQQPSYDEMVLMLEDARSKADEHWDQFLRAKAEVDNIRRRAERDLQNAHKYALERFVKELLPVLDSLELGLAATEGNSDEVAKIREGMELTLKMLSGAVGKFGVTDIYPLGKPFDPQLHEAMSMQESNKVEPGSVLMVIQKGYLLNDRLIRPAKVIVAKEGSPQSDE
jgi:molecular chaperone GrpE